MMIAECDWSASDGEREKKDLGMSGDLYFIPFLCSHAFRVLDQRGERLRHGLLFWTSSLITFPPPPMATPSTPGHAHPSAASYTTPLPLQALYFFLVHAGILASAWPSAGSLAGCWHPFLAAHHCHCRSSRMVWIVW